MWRALLVAVLSCIPVLAQAIQQTLWGEWIVKRALPTTSISCWGEKEAKALIGTELEYSTEIFRWNKTITRFPVAQTATVTAQQFHDENSGMGRLSSQVTFRQLGIRAPQAVQVVIKHPPAGVTRGTSEIPGDRVLIKDKDTIIISACSVYFEAKRK